MSVRHDIHLVTSSALRCIAVVVLAGLLTLLPVALVAAAEA
ncbi:MAG: hypothetical protein ABI573_06845 [Chloroflexota bacterium]